MLIVDEAMDATLSERVKCGLGLFWRREGLGDEIGSGHRVTGDMGRVEGGSGHADERIECAGEAEVPRVGSTTDNLSGLTVGTGSEGVALGTWTSGLSSNVGDDRPSAFRPVGE